MLLLLTACSIHSGLGVPPGEAFELGSNDHGAYRARVQNVGPVPVGLQLGEAEALTLSPGERTRVKVAANEDLSVINDSDQDAQLDLRARGDVALSMGYVPLD